MKRIVLSAACAIFLAAGASLAQAAASECKGLDQGVCTSNGACTWRQALVAGETVTKAGTPAKRNVKAHCRKGPAVKAAPPAKQSQAERT